MHHANRVLLVWGALLLLSSVLRAQLANHVVISEFYGGGGNSGAYYKNDFVELYNPTNAPISMVNWSIQYASASAGTFTAKTIFSGTIQAHGFFLIQEAQGSGGTANLPSPDAAGTLNFASANGKIGLARDTLAITGHASANVVDFVGYGTANDAEGGRAAPALDNTHSGERKAIATSTASTMASGGSDEFFGNGFDSNVNGSDFVSRGAQTPQSGASPPEVPPSGNQPPVISFVTRLPYVPAPGSVDTIIASIADDGVITSAIAHVRVNGGAYDSTLAMVMAGPATWIAVIPPDRHPADGTFVEYFVSAADDSSAQTRSAPGGYFVGDVAVAQVKSHPLAAIAGVAARVHGVINVATNTFAAGEGFLQDATGGIELLRTGGLPALDAGRNARVEGPIGSFNGAYGITAAAFTDTSGSSGLVPAAVSLPLGESAANANEGTLVSIAGLTTDSTGTFIAGKNYLYQTVTNDTITIRVESNGNANSLAGNPFGPGGVNATGILSFASGYLRLKPRSQTDFGFDPGDGSGTASIAPAVRLANQTSIAETLTISGNGQHTLTGVSIRIPAGWSWGDTAARALSGPGFSSAAVSVAGDGSAGSPYVISVSGAAVTDADPGKIVIRALSTPSAGGRSVFTTATRSGAGIPVPIDASPAVTILTSGFEAIASGSWSDPAVWAGGVVPGPSDDAALSTIGVIVTIASDSAQCAALTLTGSGSTANSGPTLLFAPAGTPRLTVNGRLRISGGSGTGQGGRARLSSNGNTNAALVLKGGVTTTTSNATGSGSAGLDMNEGYVRFEGASSDTLVNSTGFRLGNMIVGDGVAAKTLVWAPSRKSTLAARSILVRSGSAFLIGAASDSTANDIGNAAAAGVPTLTGGITVEAGGAIEVQEFAGGADAASVNLDGGGIVNHGTFGLRSPSAELSPAAGCHYDVRFGDFAAASANVKHIVGGSSAVAFANVSVGATDTLLLQSEMNCGPSYTLKLKGTLLESPGHSVHGIVEAARTVVLNVSQDFGGIGVVVTATGAAPGATLVRRVTGVRLGGGNNTSILRYFDLTPAVNSGLNASLDFMYADDELDGQSAGELQLWKSNDGGSRWAIQPSINDSGRHILHAAGCSSLSMFSASDPAHPLGGGGTSIAYRTGWNMVSVPNTMTSYAVGSLFLPAASHAFIFNGGYMQSDTLVNGPGYWLKFSSAETLSLAGGERMADTVEIAAGWNMIGSISVPIQTTSIVQMPPGIVRSPVFAFEGSYVRTDIIAPGYGYWIKADAPGKLVLSALVAPPSRQERATGAVVSPGFAAKSGDLPPLPPSEPGLSVSHPARTASPDVFEIRGNYPNPFNPTTTIAFVTGAPARVVIDVYDILGRKIATLLDKWLEGGEHLATWNGRDENGVDAAAGLYFVRMVSGGHAAMAKILLVR